MRKIPEATKNEETNGHGYVAVIALCKSIDFDPVDSPDVFQSNFNEDFHFDKNLHLGKDSVIDINRGQDHGDPMEAFAQGLL